MPNKVKLKRSVTPSSVPTTAQLELGELALNTHDGKLFFKKDNGAESIVTLPSDGGGNGFTYDQVSVPSSPSNGQTWRERDGSNNIIRDWFWNGTYWLSLQEFESVLTMMDFDYTSTTTVVYNDVVNFISSFSNLQSKIYLLSSWFGCMFKYSTSGQAPFNTTLTMGLRDSTLGSLGTFYTNTVNHVGSTSTSVFYVGYNKANSNTYFDLSSTSPFALQATLSGDTITTASSDAMLYTGFNYRLAR